ncbi:unnamed protein product, partial [Ectocarpus fasciculatus]
LHVCLLCLARGTSANSQSSRFGSWRSSFTGSHRRKLVPPFNGRRVVVLREAPYENTSTSAAGCGLTSSATGSPEWQTTTSPRNGYSNLLRVVLP